MKNKWIITLICICMSFCSIVLSGCNNNIEDHEIFLTSQNINLGRAEGAGIYKTNEEVTITAVPTGNEDSFILWMKNGFVVSYSNPYTFEANNETEGKYTAVFASENQDLISLTGVNYQEAFITGSTVSEIRKINIYLDNKEYYQTLNLSVDNLYVDENFFVLYEVSGITPEYVLDYTSPIYAKIEITYVKTDGEGNETTYIKSSNETINLDDSVATIEIKLNTIADALNIEQTPELILTFSPLEQRTDINDNIE